MNRFFVASILIACLVVPVVAEASPITYTSTRVVGAGSANLSITTDGTLGVLGDANILDWLITVAIGPDSFTLQGPLGGNNSAEQILGSALTGTPTSLLFDFSAPGFNYALFQSPSIGAGTYFYCLQTNGCFDSSGPGEGINPYNFFAYDKTSLSGQVSIAEAPSVAAVPEPGTMSLLAIGGAAMASRLRRRQRSS